MQLLSSELMVFTVGAGVIIICWTVAVIIEGVINGKN